MWIFRGSFYGGFDWRSCANTGLRLANERLPRFVLASRHFGWATLLSGISWRWDHNIFGMTMQDDESSRFRRICFFEIALGTGITWAGWSEVKRILWSGYTSFTWECATYLTRLTKDSKLRIDVHLCTVDRLHISLQRWYCNIESSANTTPFHLLSNPFVEKRKETIVFARGGPWCIRYAIPPTYTSNS